MVYTTDCLTLQKGAITTSATISSAATSVEDKMKEYLDEYFSILKQEIKEYIEEKDCEVSDIDFDSIMSNLQK